MQVKKKKLWKQKSIKKDVKRRKEKKRPEDQENVKLNDYSLNFSGRFSSITLTYVLLSTNCKAKIVSDII